MKEEREINKIEKTNPKQGRGKHREHKFFFWKISKGSENAHPK